MRKKLLINEVAKLLNISTHTIRYYDKEGLLTSTTEESSGYRLFDNDDIYRLSNIVLLRDSGISVKEIKSLLDNYNATNYQEKLEEGLIHLNNERERINKQEQAIKAILSSFEEKDFKVIEMQEQNYFDLREIKYGEEVSPLEYLNLYTNLDIKEMNYIDLVYLLEEQSKTLLVECDNQTPFQMVAGKYLTYTFNVKSDDSIVEATSQLYLHALNQNLTLSEKVFLRIKPHGMLIVSGGYRATIMAQLV